jgi:mono/diheme cytochrome c family protein
MTSSRFGAPWFNQLRVTVVVAVWAAIALEMTVWASTGATVVKVTVGKPREMAFTLTPSKVSAGTVTFEVSNSGKLPHAFQVCSSPLRGRAATCAGPKTAIIAPGKTAMLVAKLAIGKHQYHDPITGHTAARGTLFVVIAAAQAAGGKGGTTTTPAGAPSGNPPGGGGSGGGASSGVTTTDSGGASGNLVGDPVAGATVFATAGCTSCHTLKAAGSTGGIDLDAFPPDQATVIDNVTNGNSQEMPNFSLRLTKAQISNVASYVFCVTHGHTPQNC